MTDEIVFDNFLVTDDKVVAEKWTEQTFQIKSAAEKASSGGVSSSHTLREGQTSVGLIIKIQSIAYTMYMYIKIRYCGIS